ncbi:MAG TPA: hypothetical protein VEY50_09360 [Lysobacter sp.]|nr:hypothetical protein [Lysobacter sp.]
MAIPPFSDHGLLPAGVWDCKLEEAGSALCWNQHRQHLWKNFERFLAEKINGQLPKGTPLWIDGSFVRRKEFPDDIDVVIDLTSLVDDLAAIRKALEIRIAHEAIKKSYRVDAWARHPVIPNDLAAYFQYAGAKCAAELSINNPKHPKGILRVTL